MDESMEQSKNDGKYPGFKRLAWVLSFLKPYALVFSFTVFLSLLVITVELVLPKMIQHLLDVIIPGRDTNQLFSFLPLLAGILIIIIVIQAINQRTRAGMQEKLSRDVQLKVSNHIENLGFPYFEKHSVGESTALLHSETDALLGFYRSWLPQLIQHGLISVISIAYMFTLSVKLFAVLLPFIFIYYLAGPLIERKISYYGKQWANERIRLNQKLHETVSAQLELKANHAERWDTEESLATLNSHNRMIVWTYSFMNIRNSARTFFHYLGGAAVIVYGVHLAANQALTIGTLAAFLLYTVPTMTSMSRVVTVISEIKVLLNQMERLHQTILLQPEVKESEQPVKHQVLNGELQLDHVAYGYQQGKPIIKGVTLHIKAGERIGLVGPSGEGKSTLLKLIPRFYDVQEGSIHLDGVDVRRMALRDLRESIGVVFQETYLFASSIMDNIRFGNPAASDDEVMQAAILASAHTFINEMPDGYDTLVGERGVLLSGGQKQRIALARVFLKKPKILLLDEATSALDNENEKIILSSIRNHMQGITIISVAHRISTIMDYDRIIYFENGKIMESGTYQELISTKSALSKLVHGETVSQI